MTSGGPERIVRRRRSDGEQSRAAILEAAARLATVEGLRGLSIGRLAEAVGMSKSGLFAHFGSKEELQLATIDRAVAVFEELVASPAAAAEPGLERLQTLVDGYLRYLAAETFPGGCFFASVLAEVDGQPGPVRDRVVGFVRSWVDGLESTIGTAQAAGQVDDTEDAAQLAYEVEAALFLGNAQYVLSRTTDPLDRARRAVERALGVPVVSGRTGSASTRG